MPRTRSIAWSQLKLGLLGIVATSLFVTIVVALGGQGGFFWERYPLKLQFKDVLGLKTGAVVRLAGKDVGTVTSVEFVGALVEVGVDVSKKVRPLITDQSVGTVGSLSLLGESMVEISAAPGGNPLPDWGLVKTSEVGALRDLQSTASESLESASQLLAGVQAGKGTLGRLVTDDALYRELERFVSSAATVTRNLNEGSGTLGRLMTDPAAFDSLNASLANLRAMTDRINDGQGALGRFLQDEALGRSLAGSVTNIEETTGRLNRGEGTMGKLLTDRELYDRLSQMTARVDDVMAGLSAGQGTAGQLLRDRQLYENMNRAVTELRDLLADIRKDPKRYLRVSVSIF